MRLISNRIKELTIEGFAENLNDNRWLLDNSEPVSGQIEKILSEDNKESKKKEKVLQRLGNKIPNVAKSASKFGTTLWFAPKDKLEGKLIDLIATGQFTMCYNIYTHLYRMKNWENTGYDSLSNEEKQALEELEKAVREHWNEFKKDPYFMIEEGV